MENQETRDLVSIPYFVHEGDMDRADRAIPWCHPETKKAG